MPLLFFLFFFFWFFVFRFLFPKKAPGGLKAARLARTSTATRASPIPSTTCMQGGERVRGKERREEKYAPCPPPPKKESKKSHNRKIYVPSIMEECAPQTDGSAQADVLLVFL